MAKTISIIILLFITAPLVSIWLTLPDRHEYKLYKLVNTNEVYLGQDVTYVSDSTFTIETAKDTLTYNVNEYLLRQ